MKSWAAISLLVLPFVQLCNVHILGSQIKSSRRCGAMLDMFTCRRKLAAGPLRKGAHVREHVAVDARSVK
jgi:hypothetical protein